LKGKSEIVNKRADRPPVAMWLGLLVVACGITVTLALVLGGKPDAPADPAMQQTSDRTGTSLLLGSGRSVPKLLLRQPPVERVAARFCLSRLGERLGAHCDLTGPNQGSTVTTRRASSFNIVHNLAQRLHDIAGHLKRIKSATGSGGSVP